MTRDLLRCFFTLSFSRQRETRAKNDCAERQGIEQLSDFFSPSRQVERATITAERGGGGEGEKFQVTVLQLCAVPVGDKEMSWISYRRGDSPENRWTYYYLLLS